MTNSVCLYLQMHQPWRVAEPVSLAPVDLATLWHGTPRADNKAIFEKVAQKSYIPMLTLLCELIDTHPHFAVSFGITGTLIAQCEAFPRFGGPIITLLQQLAQSGRVEFLAETEYHSLAFLYSFAEWAAQIAQHRKTLQRVLGVAPTAFRNTELIYRDDLAEAVRQMGYHTMLAEGWAPNLRALPTQVHTAAAHVLAPTQHAAVSPHAIGPVPEQLNVLTKHYQLSDDLAFRFGNSGLTADSYAQWIKNTPGDSVNLFMDFETFGEHQWENIGIFAFMRHLPVACAEQQITFQTVTQTSQAFAPAGEYHAPDFVSWADEQRDITAWVENTLQQSVLADLAAIEQHLFAHRDNPAITDLMELFRRLTTSDHVYYMCTKYAADGDVHAYFSPYESPYHAYRAIERITGHLREQFTKA